ncbi:nuclear transport factor 2 family protein [Paraburkholderia sp. J63]|uniref:nuclear transport factor 2 family protein n=1 Tax=Paraburkholderia sp. J63 TaxID=2805434 RepID=UPI002ABD544A|nr:nuclear transport factor 2 family protein [Paraburkholderia sp. J63]
MKNANDVHVADEIARLERARCQALVEADLATLGELVADDVVHVHANGKTDDKAAYLAAVSQQIRFLSATREDLDVRVYGDVAVATGALRQSIELMASGQRMDMSIMTTQVWRRQMNAWQQVSFQATNL